MVAAFVDDLLFRSKIRAVAAHTQALVTFPPASDDVALAGARLVIVDLDGPKALDTIRAIRATLPALRIVGFVSHVNTDRIHDAREAGVSEVLARSGFVHALPGLLRPAPAEQ